MWVLQFTFTEFEWLNEKDIDRAFVSYPIFSKSQSEECNIKKDKGIPLLSFPLSIPFSDLWAHIAPVAQKAKLCFKLLLLQRLDENLKQKHF